MHGGAQGRLSHQPLHLHAVSARRCWPSGALWQPVPAPQGCEHWCLSQHLSQLCELACRCWCTSGCAPCTDPGRQTASQLMTKQVLCLWADWAPSLRLGRRSSAPAARHFCCSAPQPGWGACTAAASLRQLPHDPPSAQELGPSACRPSRSEALPAWQTRMLWS